MILYKCWSAIQFSLYNEKLKYNKKYVIQIQYKCDIKGKTEQDQKEDKIGFKGDTSTHRKKLQTGYH